MYWLWQELITGSHGDPRVSNYFLMKSPMTLLMITVFYLSFVLKLGPALMKNRQPFKLDKILIIYNILQIAFNLRLCILGPRVLSETSIFCTPADPSYSEKALIIVNLQYSYTLLKIADLVDTIFFVLRKKQDQITFLHVYHHTVMVVSVWLSLKYFCCGHAVYLGYPNVIVHSIMYFYYFLTSWDSTYKKSIWWKKYLTQLQIVQHYFVLATFSVAFFNRNCTYSKGASLLIMINALVMIFLFMKFYKKKYATKKNA